jgi:hypothetical protein
MTGKLQKRISKLLTTPLRKSLSFNKSSKRQDNNASRSITIACTPEHSTEDILSQLQEVSQDRHVTSIVLQEMIQRPDNVQLFCKIQDLLRNCSKNSFGGVTNIHLLEPRIHFTDYRRWCYKRTNFIQRVRKDAKERRIDITIHGTLIFDASGNASNAAGQEQLSLNIASWLALFQQLPQDPDITSLHVSLKEEPVVYTAHPAADTDVNNVSLRRPSQLELLQSPVQKVFQALVELFNSDTRQWRFINCHVQYHPNDQTIDRQQQQTQSLMDVAELYQIPLQVQWQPLASAASKNAVVGWTSISSTAEHRFPEISLAAQAAAVTFVKHDDDNTSTTCGSSGALMAS